MEPKKYSSYAEIERDLEVLKLEKEIHYQKLVLSIQQTKEDFTPKRIVDDFVISYLDSVTLPFGKIFKSALPFILQTVVPIVIKWISNRKRGD